MDKKTNIGLALCFGILVIFWWLNKPSEEQREQWQRYYDSLARVQQLQQDSLAQARALQSAAEDTVSLSDTAKALLRTQKYGLIADAVEGEKKYVTIENNLLKVSLSSQGGKIANVEMKGYKSYSDSVLLMYGDESATNFGFPFIHNNRVYNTNDLYFSCDGVKQVNDSTQSVVFRLNIGDGSLEYAYTLMQGQYEVGFAISSHGLADKISTPRANIDLGWDVEMPEQENGRKSESMWSGVYYRYSDGDVEELSSTGNADAEENMSIDWVAYKNQYFSSIFLAKNDFAGVSVKSEAGSAEGDGFIKKASSVLGVKYDLRSDNKAEFSFFFLPNYFYTLDSYTDMQFTKLLPLSWGIFRWINEYFIIPLFKYLELVFSNYGVIILVLTIIIKLILFPFTFSSFKSQAKMRVLKPQIDEINKKYPAEKAMERQQATMNLYKKAGINPMGGCLPMLLQMPVLFAAFRFFPAAIELRGQSFAWANDLSTYDSILDLPFSIPFYGDHVSLFCLLMCVTQVIYTKFTMQSQNTSSMPGMSFMMYLMPVMLLFFFNDYPAGLCYYYFLSTLITVIQTTVIKAFFIDEKAILAQIEKNQKKPVKKGRFQQYYERKMKELEQQSRQNGRK